MRVELYIRGEFFKAWEFQLLEFYDPLCELSHDERKEMWSRILENCKREVEFVIKRKPYEFFFILPARKQPENVDPDDYEKFLMLLIENKRPAL